MLFHLALAKNDVSKIVFGPLSDYTINFLRHVKDFLGLTFKLETFKDETNDDDDEELQMGGDKVLLTCVGSNYRNVSYGTK